MALDPKAQLGEAAIERAMAVFEQMISAIATRVRLVRRLPFTFSVKSLAVTMMNNGLLSRPCPT